VTKKKQMMIGFALPSEKELRMKLKSLPLLESERKKNG
jgi:hypothetical protein